jgi:DNA repair exonuclease SbcCD nuclease subunit
MDCNFWIPRKERMKALIFSDLHLHSHKDRIDRLDDCTKVLDWVFQQAETYNCDYIFFLGDLFHERDKIDVLNYLRTFECFLKNMMDSPHERDIFLLVGNHDMYHRERWDVNSIRPLSAIQGINVIQSPLSIELGGKRIDWLPHTEDPISELDTLKKEDGAGDILMAHVAVHGAIANLFYGTKADVIVEYDNDMVPVEVSLFDDWPRVFLGHYHGGQKLSDTVEYVGSPLQLSFGEAFQQKHVIVLDLDTMNREYIINDFSPPHLIVSQTDIENEAYNLDGAFVRLATEDMGRKDLLDIQRQVQARYTPLSFDTKKKDVKKKEEEEDTTPIEDVRAILQNIEDMLEKYMKDKGTFDEEFGELEYVPLLGWGKKCLTKEP